MNAFFVEGTSPVKLLFTVIADGQVAMPGARDAPECFPRLLQKIHIFQNPAHIIYAQIVRKHPISRLMKTSKTT